MKPEDRNAVIEECRREALTVVCAGVAGVSCEHHECRGARLAAAAITRLKSQPAEPAHILEDRVHVEGPGRAAKSVKAAEPAPAANLGIRRAKSGPSVETMAGSEPAVPGAYHGYTGAQGNHVRAILDALPAPSPSPPLEERPATNKEIEDLAIELRTHGCGCSWRQRVRTSRAILQRHLAETGSGR